MRHTVRPFVTVYKSRSSKIRKPPPESAEQSKSRPEAPPVEQPPAQAPSGNGHDDGYAAALRAADALFGGAPVEPAAPAAPPAAPAGRILPSLVENGDRPPVAPREAPPKPRRPRRTTTAPKAAAAPEIRAIAKLLVDATPVDGAAEGPVEPTPGRRREAIKKRRWLRKSELKPGERWKRRLRKPARR